MIKNIFAVALATAIFSFLATSSVVAGEKKFEAYLTGYSYWDNTPPGSSAIARPVIHQRAGGTGTYNDPITIAVGHSIVNGKQTFQFPIGARFYLPSIKRYAIIEDACGDGPKPQNGACWIGKSGRPWIDIYVGGKNAGPGNSDACMRKITGFTKVILNPKKGYPVVSGALAESGCRTN